MEHENFAKSHGIFLSVMEVYQFCHQNVSYLFFDATKKLSINVESSHFPMFSTKHHKRKIAKRDGHGKLTSGYGKVMEKNVKSGNPEN